MGNFPESVRGWLVACLLCLGFWQFGQGAYIPAKAWLAQELMQRAWQRSAENGVRKNRGNDSTANAAPWPWADTWPVARLSDRSRDIELIVLAGSSGRTLAFGPGHMSASAMPGEAGNSVIAGHRDTHFRFLRDVEIGELLVVEPVSGLKHLYRVVDIDVIDSRRATVQLDTDDAFLTLITCYPFEARDPGGPMRYVVTARMLF